MRESDSQYANEAAEPDVQQTNSAKRIFAIVTVALQQNNGVPALVAWAQTFGIDIAVANENPHEVTDRLRLMNEEIGVLRRAMQKTQFSAELYDPALQNILRLLSVTNLAAGWNSYVGSVSEANMLALRWCAEAIDVEVGLTVTELQSLLDALNVFKDHVEMEDLPESVRDFLLRQIELMIQGLNQYSIIGRRAARDAVKRAAAEFMDVDETISDAAAPSHWVNLAKLWKTLLAGVEGGEKMVKAVTGIAENVPKLADVVSTAAKLIS